MLSQTPYMIQLKADIEALRKLASEPNIFVKRPVCSACDCELDYDELDLCAYCQELHDIEIQAENQMEADREDI